MPFDELQQYGQAKANEIVERRKARKVETEKAAGDTKLKAFWAPKLWEQMREAIEQRILAINRALGERVLLSDTSSPDMVIIRVNGAPTNLSAAYDASSGKVILSLDDHSETYELDVSRGEVKYRAVGYFSPGQVGKMLVDKAASMVL